jgi:peptide/nickel transport system substrate-binding protein
MHVYVGDDDSLWKPMPGFFTPGTPLYNEEGGEILKGARNIDAAKRLLADSGYAGQPVACLVAQDLPAWKAWGEVTADLLKRLGMKVNYDAVDFGTQLARMGEKSLASRGGWQIAPLSNFGVAYIDPSPVLWRLSGNVGVNGWANIPEVEAEIAAWYEAKSLDEEKAIARRLNKAAFDHAIYAPIGWYLGRHAWRKNVTGIVTGPARFFWGVGKTV